MFVFQADTGAYDGSSFSVSRGPTEAGEAHQDFLAEDDLAAITEEKELHSFEIDPAQVRVLNYEVQQTQISCPH